MALLRARPTKGEVKDFMYKKSCLKYKLTSKKQFFFSYIFEINTWGKVHSRRLTLGTKYSRMDQVKFVEDSL